MFYILIHCGCCSHRPLTFLFSCCQLVDECLALVDPELAQHLTQHGNLNAYLYAFSCMSTSLIIVHFHPYACLGSHLTCCGSIGFCCAGVSSLSASVRPFEELVQLWDFLLSFGIHLNILCVVSQIILLRDKLLDTTSYVPLHCSPSFGVVAPYVRLVALFNLLGCVSGTRILYIGRNHC